MNEDRKEARSKSRKLTGGKVQANYVPWIAVISYILHTSYVF